MGNHHFTSKYDDWLLALRNIQNIITISLTFKYENPTEY